tara:strand:+ start:317 stop:487 length:171 start_codon:yes stop_codon:yes gene_type:complete
MRAALILYRLLQLGVLQLALALAGALLAGCGGGDDDQEPQATVQPLDCKARPELCR